MAATDASAASEGASASIGVCPRFARRASSTYSGYDPGVPLHTLLLVALSGASTGVVGSMLGIGGGAFLVPLLTLAMGFPIRAAVAASLLSVIATASATATVNLERGLVNMRLGMALAMGTTNGGLGGGPARRPRPAPPAST